jgi:cytochrome c-type biogenesis protein CcmH/NrfG
VGASPLEGDAMKRFLVAGGLLFSLTLPGSDARAQTGTARGKVVDEKGQGVAEVKVEVEFQGGVTRKYETKTNKKGEFTQVGMQPGVYRFTVSKDGYQGTFLEAKVALGDPTYLPDIALTTKGAAAAGAGAADKEMAAVRSAVEKAIELTRAGKLDEAEAIYKENIAKNPTIVVLHHNLGVLYGMKKDYASAEAAYLKAIEVKGDYSESYMALSNLYLTTNQVPKAEAFTSKAAADHPEDAKIQLQLGVVYFNTSKHEEAAAAFKKSVALDATLAEPHYYLGSIAVGQGKTAECIAELEKYLSMSPTNAQNVQTAQGLIAALKPKK